MRVSLVVVLLCIFCFSSLCEGAFTDAHVVNMTGYDPSFVFYTNDALFILFQAYFWGSQPILSKVDPSSGEILYNLPIPFTRCYPCAPSANGFQVNDNFVVITVENGTLWEIFTVDTVSTTPSVVGTYTPTVSGFIRNLLQDGQNSILLTEDLFLPTLTSHQVTYDSTGSTISVSVIQPPPIAGIEGIVFGAINLTPDLTLACTRLDEYSPPYENFLSFETTTGKIEEAVNQGWSYQCPITSISTELQGICVYYSSSLPSVQSLWCWNYTLYSGLIPPTETNYAASGAVYGGVADDSGNFIGCYSDGTGYFLTQFAVNYNQSSYDVVATSALKQNYRCQNSYYPVMPVINNRISTTFQQVAQIVANVGPNGSYGESVLLVNYDSTVTSSVKTLF